MNNQKTFPGKQEREKQSGAYHSAFLQDKMKKRKDGGIPPFVKINIT